MNVQNYIGWFSEEVLLRLQYLKDMKENGSVSILQIDKAELTIEEQANDGYASLDRKSVV